MLHSISTWLGCRSPSLLNLSHQRSVGQLTQAHPGCPVHGTHRSCSSAWHPGSTAVKRARGNPPDDQSSILTSKHTADNFTKGVGAERPALPLRCALLLPLGGRFCCTCTLDFSDCHEHNFLLLVGSRVFPDVMAHDLSASA